MAVRSDNYLNEAGTGAPNFSQGLTVPTSGGTPSTFNFYEVTTHITDWSLGGTANTSGNKTLQFTRIGNIVSIRLPDITITGAVGANANITSLTAFPSRFRPSITILAAGSRVIASGTTQAAVGHIAIGTNGLISIHRDFLNPPTSWGTSGSNGFQNDCVITYVIA